MSGSNPIRLNKFLSYAGIASRRKADDMIRDGRVRVNGRVVTDLGTKIDPQADQVFVDERQIAWLDRPIYIVFNKPNDCITTVTDERGRTTVMHYVRVKERIFPIGRLDRKTTGVILFTNDGEFAHRLMHPRYEINKAYKVTLDRAVSSTHAKALASGIRLSDGKTASAEVYSLPGARNKVVGVKIHEGRNRQIHRMFEALGYRIEKLDRVAYSGITYEGLRRGEWRHLTSAEVRTLMEAAGLEEGSRSDVRAGN